ncbi:hypothetical protein D0869_08511 [Hortaea werneckii]|uniref:DUF202 domain-containing protein n=1 Tax=Hortaea werneckii TaxID=91943 RepID=A0A3M7ACU0_HORWE|nr:hypothetical protein KC334_g5853 [Hortaea werneckii]KAI6973135.1 hypothetical protein KC355_g11600 [Hortaea werneckii]KAI7185914.1 hypothetical protein KC324_g7289 [Hortaea werneckii]KAI7583509.1 hypothetical protein KC316_g7235 [Hortaea werneckii]KAI7668018.1 hypothetical protein KC318_g5516 [Hortaea werneckii]
MLSRFSRLLRTEALANTGSLARDLLASERTFLAWTRTGLGFIALGIALEKVEAFAQLAPQLLQLHNTEDTKIAAGALVGSGTLCVAHGTTRYFGSMRDLRAGVFRPNKVGVIGLAVGSLGLAFAGTLLVLQSDRKQHDERDEGKDRKMANSGALKSRS